MKALVLLLLLLKGSSPTTVTPGSTSTTDSSSSDASCSVQCPSGYLIGTSSCFVLYPSSRAPSYQSSLALCMATDRQTLVSLDKLRDRNDIETIQASAAENQMDWFFANGIGSRNERIDKTVDVYSIFDQSLVASPVVTTVSVSQTFSNVSTLCILPQYCSQPVCDVEKLLLTFDYMLAFKSSAKLLEPKQTANLTCSYSQQDFEITCGSLGSVYPEPSLLDCKTGVASQIIGDTTGQAVENCELCLQRGTKECLEVDGGFQCVCKDGFSMSRCWKTPDLCAGNPNFCGVNGTCHSLINDRFCECDIGYSGERCEINTREHFKNFWGYSVVTGLILAIGGFVVRFVKRAASLARLDEPSDDDDPQATHQILRSYCIFVAGVLVMFFSSPTFVNISQPACRFHFIAIHFCFLMAMVQWLLEGWNVNQVLRCVHLNEWEREWNGSRSWGTRIAPRMLVSILGVAAGLLITFQAGWNQLAASWTCVGVICQSTISVWIPIFAIVLIVFLSAGAIFESSMLIKFRRPLLGYRMDLRIEREIGHVEGRRIEKCRRNEILCMVGLTILVILWFFIILSADYKQDSVIGWMTLVLALVYSVFSIYQEVETSPEDRATWIAFLQRRLPTRFAPNYNADSMWTVQEVRELYALPEAERKRKYEGCVTRNQFLHLHHRWDLRFNELLAENRISVNEALGKVFCEEMKRLKENNGTMAQKEYIQEAYKDFLRSVPDVDPRTEQGKLKGRLELVTLAAEAPIGVKLAKFFLVPGFDIFQPEIPDPKDNETDRNERQHQRLLDERIEMDYYRIMREEARAQAVFINSNILFHYFGNEVVR